MGQALPSLTVAPALFLVCVAVAQGLRPASSGHGGSTRFVTTHDVLQRKELTLATLNRLNLSLPVDQLLAALGPAHGLDMEHVPAATKTGQPRMHNVLESVHVPNVKRFHDPSIVVEVDRYGIADGNGEHFDVSWSGFEDPAYDDWIALVVPADGDPSQTAPAKWKFAASSQTHITEGRGTLRWVDEPSPFVRGSAPGLCTS
jgi:hypothetical protein